MTSGWICTEEERATSRENYSSRCWVEIVACDAPAGTSDNHWDYEDITRVVERMASHFFRSHSSCSSLLTGPGMTCKSEKICGIPIARNPKPQTSKPTPFTKIQQQHLINILGI